MAIYFISGIDTDIGKSVATGMMARDLVRRGKSVITMKLVQTGNEGFSEDLNMHREMMEVPPFPEDRAGLTSPQIFRFPASPHLAAKLENRSVDIDAIRSAALTLAERYEYVLLEGAGGLAVPLTEELWTVDFAAQLQARLILVTSGRLGSLNHTFLSLECAAAHGLPLAGLVYNCHPAADPVIDADTPEMIRNYLLRCNLPEPLVMLPEIRRPYPEIDFTALFR